MQEVSKELGGYFYLASPYSHKSIHKQIERYNEAVRCLAWLTDRGHVIFSPIVHSHPVSMTGTRGDFDFWKLVDEVFIGRSAGLLVLTLPGWAQSKGVTAELKMAQEFGLPTQFINPQGEEEYTIESNPAV